jgi:predicted Mrr-cat superfamily restriction endonuclease
MNTDTVWLVRAGEESRHAARFAASSVIAVGWRNIDGLRDLRGLSEADVLRLLRVAPTLSSPEADAGELLAFRDDIGVGDVVVTPDATQRDVLVGEVTGDYEYLDPSPAGDYRHVRTVNWFGRWDRDLLPDHLRRETNYRRTLRRLTNRQEWLNFAETMRDSARMPTAKPQGARRSTGGSAQSADRVCPGCGLLKSPAQFVSSVCRDCVE